MSQTIPWLIAALAAACVGGAGGQAPDPVTPVRAVVAGSPFEARAMGIGRYVADASGIDLAGKSASWRSGRGTALTVIALTSVTCPLSRKFTPTIQRVASAYEAKGVKCVHINVSGVDSAQDMKSQAATLKGLYLNDRDHSIASALNARTTTEVFVVDAANTLLYRGAPSDQYGLGFSLDAARTPFLEAALDAALRGELPAIAATQSPGCEIEPPASTPGPASPPTVTYSRDIARIIASNCVECHRPGGVGPFSLTDFDAVSKRASMIRTVTQEGIMPPWFAAPSKPEDAQGTKSHTLGTWTNDRSLSDAEKQAIVEWIKLGKPRGEETDLPLPRQFPKDEWTIGTPDATFSLPKPIAIKAEGTMPYQHVMVPTQFDEDRWIRGVQIIPTDKSVVHHVLVTLLPEAALTDPDVRRRARIDERDGFFAAYVPGNDAVIYPEGLARKLPRKSVLLFQIHYTPNGTATSDQMRIGFTFSPGAPKHVVRTAGISARDLNIPPNASNHMEHASVRVPADARILAFMPHMHVRGKAFRYELELPGQERQLLLDIPRYDFNWQLRYTRCEPVETPKGATIHATAWFDNSGDNPANPDPSKNVRWGEQTYDEMMLGYIDYVLVTEDPEHPDALAPGNALARPGAGRKLTLERLLNQFDSNKDGKIERSEVSPELHQQFDRLDRNKDGVIQKDDFGP